jgi:hypothetical protein
MEPCPGLFQENLAKQTPPTCGGCSQREFPLYLGCAKARHSLLQDKAPEKETGQFTGKASLERSPIASKQQPAVQGLNGNLTDLCSYCTTSPPILYEVAIFPVPKRRSVKQIYFISTSFQSSYRPIIFFFFFLSFHFPVCRVPYFRIQLVSL